MNCSQSKPKVLYLSYTGLMEPLGQSQVLSYLVRLSGEYDITLITFERKIDLQDDVNYEKIKAICNVHEITWIPKLYHQYPRVLSSIYDLLTLFFTCVKLCLSNRVDILHGRGYIPSIVSMYIGKVFNIPFVFDMRALWLEELIEGKRLKRHSFIHIVLNFLKKEMLINSSAVVSLTRVAVDYLVDKYNISDKNKFVVIPTCVDLSKFTHSIEGGNKGFLTYGTMGSVLNSRFKSDWFFHLLSKEYSIEPKSKFKIVSRDDAERIIKIKSKYNLDNANFELISSAPQEIVSNISDINVAIIFFTPGISTLGTSPTRIAEFLALGIPVIVNDDVGDTADIIRKYNVGVVISSDSNDEFELGLKKIKKLLLDTDLRQRCIYVADEIYSADSGAKKYSITYKKIIHNV